MRFAKGCKRPDPVRFAARPDAINHPAIRARVDQHVTGISSLPPSADKLPPRPRVDQGMTGSCTAASATIAAYTALESKGDPLGFVPSQRELYAATRALERAAATLPNETLPELADSGADPEDVLDALAKYGVLPMITQKTPDGRFYDIWSDADLEDVPTPPAANVNAEPQVADLVVAQPTSIQLDAAKHKINPNAVNVSDVMAAALDADPPLPIWACGFVDTAFEQLQPGQVAGAPDQNDPKGGGHAFWISAYRTNAVTGEREWKLENSWGPWDESGACWVSMAFVRALWGMWVFDVSKVTRKAVA